MEAREKERREGRGSDLQIPDDNAHFDLLFEKLPRSREGEDRRLVIATGCGLCGGGGQHSGAKLSRERGGGGVDADGGRGERGCRRDCVMSERVRESEKERESETESEGESETEREMRPLCWNRSVFPIALRAEA